MAARVKFSVTLPADIAAVLFDKAVQHHRTLSQYVADQVYAHLTHGQERRTVTRQSLLTGQGSGRTRVGTRKVSTKITFWLPEAVGEEIYKEAVRKGISVSEIVRRQMYRALEAEGCSL